MERREREIAVVMGLMCNKLHEGAFREALFSSSTHTISTLDTGHTHTHTYNSELYVTHNLIHIYKYSNTSRLF